MGLSPPEIRVRETDSTYAPVLAVLHRSAFEALGERVWHADEIASLMTLPGTRVFLAVRGDDPLGWAMTRAVVDEAELLTIAVRRDRHRGGVGRALMETLMAHLADSGCQTLHLEVGADNPPAIALYEKLGFIGNGVRPAYYARPGGARVDALMMKRALSRIVD